MTDRELLERAGAALCKSRSLPLYLHRPGEKPAVFTYLGKSWNPLEDDGDALRLAVALRITIAFHDDAIAAMHIDSGRSWPVPYKGDNTAATRLAIVRAAAQLGAD